VNEENHYSMNFNDIKKLHEQGSLRDIDYYLAEMLNRRYKNVATQALLAVALASYNMIDGHICLDLQEITAKKWPQKSDDKDELSQVTLPSKENWVDILNRSEICDSGKNDKSHTPLVLSGSRIYLRRYFNYEKLVAEKLIELAATSPTENKSSLTEDESNELLGILFPPLSPEYKEENNITEDAAAKAAEATEVAKKAAKAILKNRLLIISGGPGTGKTYTLARLIAFLAATSGNSESSLSIRMAAPTGKAAMRMRESIIKAKKDIRESIEECEMNNLKNKIADIPEDACTIHRLLGTISNSTSFRHNAENPLPADILIIDEASMIDLPMMAKIMSAMQENTKLILLGDMHQLSSVEPGSVMGDICSAAQESPDSNLGRSVVELTYSHRFAANGPVGKLSAALHDAGSDTDPEGEDAWAELQKLNSINTDKHRVQWHKTPEKLSVNKTRPIEDFKAAVWENYKDLLKAKTVKEAFDAISNFRVFSPLRKGPHGLLNINKLIEETLSGKNRDNNDKDITPLNPKGAFYNRQVIMVTRNDYGLKLFNGDIGIVMDEDANGEVGNMSAPPKKVVWFEGEPLNKKADGDDTDPKNNKKKFRSFSCNMIPEHETSFAMTIHKSQGSEYKKVMVVMPYRDNEKLFTKEMLYTAITRAKEEVNIWCNEDVFKNTACRKAECSSGLRERLTGKV